MFCFLLYKYTAEQDLIAIALTKLLFLLFSYLRVLY